MESQEISCQCACGARDFGVRLDRDEQVGLLTCSADHHSLLLDSRDYWADVLQAGRPKQTRCPCGAALFRVGLIYDLREDGDVRSVDVLLTCCECGRSQVEASFEIDYNPTGELISKPLDPIEQPWLKVKQRQITAYWQPADAQRFASYLVERLSARIYRNVSAMEECQFDSVEFYPELKHDLYFTNASDVTPPRLRDSQKAAPLVRLSSPFHIACPSGIALLHYIEYSEEILNGSNITKQPQIFLSFACQAREWLKQNYISARGRDTADHPQEYTRIVSLLPQNRAVPYPSHPQ
jgi:hypothetical protein